LLGITKPVHLVVDCFYYGMSMVAMNNTRGGDYQTI